MTSDAGSELDAAFVTDRVSTFHEAGHAVVAIAFGFDVRRVMVRQQPGTPGEEGGCCELNAWRQDPSTDLMRALLYVLSGTAAEQRLIGRASSRDARDREGAELLAAHICELGNNVQHPRVRALLAAAEAEAVALMYRDEIWNAITHVATALERQGALTGQDVQRLLREAKR